MKKPRPLPATPPEDKPGLRARDLLLLALVVLALFTAYLAVELRQNHTLGFPLDDSWIHLTFARNIARGWGFAFNHGEPVAGSTAPLWTLTLALVHVFTRNVTVVVVVTKVLGMVFLYVAALFAFLLGQHLTRSHWAGLGAGIAVASLGPMGWAMMSGMEVTLSAAVTLAGLYYYLVYRTGWRAVVAWVLLGLAAWSRPECLSLVGLVTLDTIVQRVAFRNRRLYWRGLAAWLVIVAPYFVLNWTLSRSLFPQTYTAKASVTSIFTAIATGSLSQVVGLLTKAPLSYFAGFAGHLWRANPILALLVLPGLLGLILQAIPGRRDATPRPHPQVRPFVIPLVLVFYVPVMGAVAPVFGAEFQSGRYIGNVTALASVVAAVGVFFLWTWLRSRSMRLLVVGLLLMGALFNATFATIATTRNTARAESSINRMQVALARWLAANTPTNAVLACNDIGAIGYLSGRRVIDLVGLVTPEVMKYRTAPTRRRAFIEDTKPDYLVIFPHSFPELEGVKYLTAVAYADVPDNTASAFDFVPSAHAVAGVLVLDLIVAPIRATTVVFKCDWLGTASANPPPPVAVPGL